MIATHPDACESFKDPSLKQRVTNYLRLRLPNLHSVDVAVRDEVVTLRGTVPSASIKWQCIDCCRYVAGVLNVIEKLVVLPREERHDEVPNHPS